MASVRVVRVPRRREARLGCVCGVPVSPLVVFIVETLAELLKDAVVAMSSKDAAEAERQILLKAQRRISDEIARREFGVIDHT